MVGAPRTKKKSLALAAIVAFASTASAASIACGVNLTPPDEDAIDRPSTRSGGHESTTESANLPAPEASDASGTPGASADAGATGDAGNVLTQTSSGGPSGRPYLVFVSSKQYASNDLGGLAGADQKCSDLANASYNPLLHDRNWVAWLSDGNTSAVSRLGNTPGPWINGTLTVANDRSHLTGPSALGHAIDLDEKAYWRDGDVWTGTLASGDGDANCGGWTGDSASGQGRIGSIVSSKPNWTSRTQIGCGYNNNSKPMLRIYCFEVD